jgi:Ala-tRNA(Pro) deacylase
MEMRRIREFLDRNHVRYVVMSHSPAYTASQVARSIHIPGRSLAKVVIVVINGQLAMVVVPADKDVDMTLLQTETGANDVRLADEAEFARKFEGCKLGAVPPFGNLFGVDTYLDASLADASHITFNAGTHTDVIVMHFNDYCDLARPRIAHLSVDPIETRFYVAQL